MIIIDKKTGEVLTLPVLDKTTCERARTWSERNQNYDDLKFGYVCIWSRGLTPILKRPCIYLGFE